MILEQPLAFIDVETTGLDPNTHEIIELAVLIAKMKDGVLTITGELDVKIVPEHIENAEPQALRINGYNEADWLFAVRAEDAMKQFVEITKGAIFVAHNVTFDFSFIDAALKRYQLEDTMHFYKLDTISLAFGLLHTQEDINRYSLKALCEHFGIHNKQAHSAYADAYVTYEIFKKLLKLS